MKIKLTNLGKRYNRDWVFRKLEYEFLAPKKYAITGPNGSGKSTLLQIISGGVFFNEGDIQYSGKNNKIIASEKIYRHISLAAPYLELIEEMTLLEFFAFHQKMKGWLENITVQQIIGELKLEDAANKQIRYFSSGMKQRVKLAQAIFSNVPVILLDEPLTNLDDAGIILYHSLISNFCMNKMVIVSSNDPKEYSFCQEEIDIKLYK
ncbi:MAG: ATP-binding cassette domain-containing protein [Ginsengibacter sp.]